MNGLLRLGYKADKTPDFRDLKNSEYARHLVMVYDDFKRGRVNHFMMDGADYYGHAHTMYAGLCLKKTSTNVGVLLSPKKIKGKREETYRLKTTGQIIHPHDVGRVEGDLFSVSLHHLCQIDKANNNTVLNERRLVWVIMQDGPNHGKTCRAWVYFAKEKELNTKWPIKDLRQVNRLIKNNVNIHYI